MHLLTRVYHTRPRIAYIRNTHCLSLSLNHVRARARTYTHTHTHTHTHTLSLSLSLHTHTHTRPDIACIIHGLAHAPTHSLLLVVAAGNGPLSWRCIIKHTSTQCWGCDRATWRAWGVRRRRAHLSSRCVMLDVYVCSRIMHVHMYVSCKCRYVYMYEEEGSHFLKVCHEREREREREREKAGGEHDLVAIYTHTDHCCDVFLRASISPRCVLYPLVRSPSTRRAWKLTGTRLRRRSRPRRRRRRIARAHGHTRSSRAAHLCCGGAAWGWWCARRVRLCVCMLLS